jgi:hypothetical protein
VQSTETGPYRMDPVNRQGSQRIAMTAVCTRSTDGPHGAEAPRGEAVRVEVAGGSMDPERERPDSSTALPRSCEQREIVG